MAPGNPLPPFRVLIVDDSPVVRKALHRILGRDPELTVVGEAADPYEARARILQLRPDVLTLDIEMPRMDGLTFLKILARECPLPVVIISSLSYRGSRIALEALSHGAVEIFGKPDGSASVPHEEDQLREKVKTAARVGARTYTLARPPHATNPRAAVSAPPSGDPRRLLLLGASTGGTEALAFLLSHLPAHPPAILIVQHLPAIFTTSFADRLNRICPFPVAEAQDGEAVVPGRAYLAPGGWHLSVQSTGLQYGLKLLQTAPVWHQRPAVDVLFQSAARLPRTRFTAALLTGMGRDGAEGLLALRRAGAATFAEDESTCVVFGMPRAAMEIGAAQKMVPLHRLPALLSEAMVSPAPVPA